MKHLITACTLVLAAALPTATLAQSKATAAEATAMVKKGVIAIKAGKDKVYSEVTAKDAKWVDRDLYLVVYGLDGTVRAHGANAKLVGENLMDLSLIHI